MTSYSIEAVHANFIFPSGYIGERIKKQYKVPLVVHERSLTRLNMARAHASRKKVYIRVLEEADTIITMNRNMVALLRQMTSPTKEIVLLPAAADTDFVPKLKQKKPLPYEGKQIILIVASLIERKGHDYLLKAIHLIKDEFPHLRCLIIGDGSRRNQLQALIRQLNLSECVEMLGKRPHEEVLRTMSWCDLFVLASWNEPFGTVIAEALASSKPVVVCEGEGASEFLTSGTDCLLVKKQDSGSLADAIKKILNDPEFAERLGHSAGKLAEEKLSYRSLAEQMIKIYERNLYC